MKKSVDRKDDEIVKLKKLNSNKNDELKELKESYKIHSDYEIIDEWYVVSDDYLDIELSGYEDAIKVDFCTLQLNV